MPMQPHWWAVEVASRPGRSRSSLHSSSALTKVCCCQGLNSYYCSPTSCINPMGKPRSRCFVRVWEQKYKGFISTIKKKKGNGALLRRLMCNISSLACTKGTLFLLASPILLHCSSRLETEKMKQASHSVFILNRASQALPFPPIFSPFLLFGLSLNKLSPD